MPAGLANLWRAASLADSTTKANLSAQDQTVCLCRKRLFVKQALIGLNASRRGAQREFKVDSNKQALGRHFGLYSKFLLQPHRNHLGRYPTLSSLILRRFQSSTLELSEDPMPFKTIALDRPRALNLIPIYLAKADTGQSGRRAQIGGAANNGHRVKSSVSS